MKTPKPLTKFQLEVVTELKNGGFIRSRFGPGYRLHHKSGLRTKINHRTLHALKEAGVLEARVIQEGEPYPDGEAYPGGKRVVYVNRTESPRSQ